MAAVRPDRHQARSAARRRLLSTITAVALVASALVVLRGPNPAGAAAGDIDFSFGDGGSTTTGLTSEAAADVAVQPDGKLVTVGAVRRGAADPEFPNRDIGFSRHLANGTLDSTFGSGGTASVDLGSRFDNAQAVVVQPDGKIVAAGAGGPEGGFALVRVLPNGAPDTGFGTGGVVLTTFGEGGASGATSLVLHPDGRLTAVGWANPAGVLQFAAARYGPDGALDPGFGSGGRVVTLIGEADAQAFDAALSGDRLVAVGAVGAAGAKDWAIVVYGPNGALDPSFGAGGILVTSPAGLAGDDIAYGVAAQPDGRIVVAGEGAPNVGSGIPVQVLRLLADGTRDPSLGGAGRTGSGVFGDFSVRDVVVQPNGTIVVGSSVAYRNGDGFFDRQIYLQRYRADGSGLNSGFVNFTAGDEIVNALALQEDGKVVGAGGGDPGFLMFRYLGDPPPLPAMGRITFAKSAGGNSDVWVVYDNGSFPANLTSRPGFDGDPAFSPDGSRIAFVSDRRAGVSDRDVFYMNADGTDVQMVPNSPIWDADPEWSPDGSKIVFARDMGGQNFDLWVFDTTQAASPTNPSPLTTNVARSEGFPTWSPDGSTIAYRSVLRGASPAQEDVYAIASGGGAETPLTTDAGLDTAPSWSPDGAKIAFASNRAPHGGNFEIYVMNADGSAQTRVTRAAGADSAPDWSPDGIRLVYQRADASLPNTLHIADADGTNEAPVVTGDDNVNPSWVGDGLRLTVDRPVSPASPSALALDRLVLSPNAPGPDGLPLLDQSLAGLPLLDQSLAGLPLLDQSLAGLPLLDQSLAGLPLLDQSLAGLPLLDQSLAGLPLLDQSLAGLPLLDQALAGLPPIPDPGGWEGILNLGSPYAGQSIMNVSVRQVLQLLPPPGQPFTYQAQEYIAKLCLCDIDWLNAASSLRTIGAVPLALSKTTFGMISLPSGDAGWCARFGSAGFDNCGAAFGGLDGTLLGYQAAGGDLTLLPVNRLLIGNLNLAKAALLGFSLLNADLSVGLEQTPIGAIRISDLPQANRDLVVDCQTPSSLNCASDNLATAGDLGRLRPTGRFSHLGTFPSAGVFTPIPAFAAFAVGEVVFTLLPVPPIEDLSYENLRVAHYGGPTSQVLDYHLTYTYGGSTTVPQVTAQVTLPQSFVYVGGSSRLTTVTGGAVTRSGEVINNPSISGSVLTWVLPDVSLQRGTYFKVDFQARPGLRTGTWPSLAELSGTGFSEAAAGQAPVVVTQNFEDVIYGEDEFPSTVQPFLERDTAYFTHISPGDVDTFRYRVPVDPADSTKALVGARVQVIASHFANDNDLTVYLPRGLTPAAPLRTSTPNITLRGTPVVAQPQAPIPVADSDVALNTGVVKPAEQVVHDVPNRTDLAVGGRSASHGLYDEFVEVEVPEGAQPGDFFTVELRGFNNSGSDQPATLRVREYAPAKLPECSARARPNQGQTLPPGLVLPAPTAIRSSTSAAPTETLVLFSPKRMFESYGAADTLALKDQLTSAAFLDRADVNGQVISLDQIPAVDAAFAAYDADPCNLATANLVAAAINGVVDSLLVDWNDYQLRSVVIIGTDEVIPHQRTIDYTRKYNERLYRPDLDFTTKDGNTPAKGNALLSAIARGYVVSDGAYGDLAPHVFDGGYVDVPQLAVGRLVESSAQVTEALKRFVQFDGKLDPASSMAAGYDAVIDNAQAVDQGFAAAGIADRKLLASNTWTAADYVGALKSADPAKPRSLINANGHHNHHLMQPAAGAQLFSTTPLPNQTFNLQQSVGDLGGRGIFTMSCHTALNVADILLGAPTAGQQAKLADWPQAYGAKGAAFLVGSSGYGYADRYTLGYGERLITSFAAALTPGARVADAFVGAQQQYFASLAVNGVYDNKTLSTTILFGLPMYRIAGTPPAGGPGPGPAAVLPTPVPDTPGLSKATVTHTPALTERRQADGTAFFVDGGRLPQMTQDQPIGALGGEDITVTDKTAAGALVTSFRYQPVTGYRNSISRPTADTSALEPVLQPEDVLFPLNLNRVGTEFGKRQTLVVPSTQYQAAGTTGGVTVGTLRKHGPSVHDVYYVDDAAVLSGERPAGFRVFESEVAANTLTVNVEIESDFSPASVKKVLVLFTELVPGAPEVVSKQLWLTQDPTDSSHWSGSAAVTTDRVEAIAQTLKSNGLVGLSVNKRAGVGGAAAPIIAIASPLAKAYTVGTPLVADYSCIDGATGRATPTCEGTVPDGAPLDTTTPGRRTFEVRAVSAGGATAVQRVTYSVQYNFVGFFSPIKNPPTRNAANSGQSIPVKWRLTNAAGVSFGGLRGQDASLLFRQVPCSPGQTVSPIPFNVLLPAALTYDPVAKQYIQVVQTPASFKNTCQEMRLTFYGDDATTRTADFEFK